MTLKQSQLGNYGKGRFLVRAHFVLNHVPDIGEQSAENEKGHFLQKNKTDRKKKRIFYGQADSKGKGGGGQPPRPWP